MNEPRRASIALAPRPAEIGRALAACHAFFETLALPATAIHQVTLAIDELLTNIVTHGALPDDAPHIAIDLAYRDGELTVALSDPGRPFDPHDAPPPDLTSPLESRRIGGLGVHLARTLVDRFDYRHDGRRNHVLMTKRIGSGA